MSFDLIGEDVDGARDEARRAVRMRARAAARDLRGETAQAVDVEPLERVGHRRKAEHARAALSGALLGEIAGDVQERKLRVLDRSRELVRAGSEALLHSEHHRDGGLGGAAAMELPSTLR